MQLKDFDYDLPKELIAQTPIINRDESRLLMFLDKIEHKTFKNILDFLNKGDTVVLNNSKVIPARLFGHKETGGKVEILLLKKLNETKWKALVKAKKMKVGAKIVFSDDICCEIIEKESEVVILNFNKSISNYIKEHGDMPIPPYIKEKLEDKGRYQTVYAKELGSAAAPTAGLHFTKELLKELKDKGINICYVTLHVGLGTFLPVKVDNVKEHKMHEEYIEINKETCDVINETTGKIISIGTTTLRSLESAKYIDGKIMPTTKSTDIFIYPGYKFKSSVTHLITNFHLPKSTLLMLVSAFRSREEIMLAYQEAIKEKYRFFSFGDAMLISKNNDL